VKLWEEKEKEGWGGEWSVVVAVVGFLEAS